MAFNNIIELLERVALYQPPSGILSYAEGQLQHPRQLTYQQLITDACARANYLRSLPDYEKNGIVLLHFSDHLDNMLWYWATLYADCKPALSTPLSNDLNQRRKHLEHLYSLFEDPLCLTRLSLSEQFLVVPMLRVQVIDDFTDASPITTTCLGNVKRWLSRAVERSLLRILRVGPTPPSPRPSDIAMLMLTSGSTGNSKGVGITHEQVLASVRGKSTVTDFPPGGTHLNWVGLDHVAGLMECHLEAIYRGTTQVHVQPPDVITDPLRLLQLADKHRVAKTFAPNFFLANLVRASETTERALELDLSCLMTFVSGGESNPVKTCQEVAWLLSRYGAPKDALNPAFGMTETCAGSIYNRRPKSFAANCGNEYSPLGLCVPGIQMRVISASDHDVSGGEESNQPGRLEVRGPIVFKGYYNNSEATLKAFDEDGWFDTGDEAIIDSTGALHIIGRSKETLNINGMKFIPTDIETGLDDASIQGAVPSYFLCFSFRPKGSQTEQLCVVYLPSSGPDDDSARVETSRAITRNVMLQTGVYPYVLPLGSQILQKSTLGKLSRSKIRTAFIEGKLDQQRQENDRVMRIVQEKLVSSEKATDTEKNLLTIFHSVMSEVLEMPDHVLGLETPLFEIGLTSIHLIVLKQKIERTFQIKEIPILTLISNPTIRSLANAIEEKQTPKPYDPVVVLRPDGNKSPLWLFHPGVGEVLVFLGLGKYFDDRPVYALRARGFNEGESFFQNINDAVSTYFAAIKARQPHGPYAMAGYSYGAMLAFETAKRLEASEPNKRSRVAFLGSFNLPPHIKQRMRQFDWVECALHLAYFLSLIDEQRSREIKPSFRTCTTRNESLDKLISHCDAGRLAELSLTKEAFGHWADLALSMQSMARDYEPQGRVSALDVFYCNPLKAVADSKAQWREEHLDKWRDFCAEQPRFHEVEGAHYTMIDKDHVHGFQKVLRKALDERNV